MGDIDRGRYFGPPRLTALEGRDIGIDDDRRSTPPPSPGPEECGHRRQHRQCRGSQKYPKASTTPCGNILNAGFMFGRHNSIVAVWSGKAACENSQEERPQKGTKKHKKERRHL